MCGIFFYSGEGADAEEITYRGLEKLEYRGYDSFGIGSIDDDGKVYLQKFIGKVSGVENKNNFKRHSTNLAIGHTRWATHGKVAKQNAHPHLSYDKKLLLVHNGIFENFQEVKDILLKQKIKFNGETDSEVMVNWIAYRMQKEKMDFYTAAKKSFEAARGSSAFIVVDTQSKNWAVYRNGSALHIGKSKSGVMQLASDVSALFEHTQNIYSLKDGEFITNKSLDGCKFKKAHSIQEIVSKNGFAHFTLKEIYDQKWSIEKAYNSTKTFTKKELESLQKKQIIFTGCGTAFNVALAAVYLLAEKGISARAISANEFESFKHTINKNTVLFAISQSGETADTIIACKMVKQKGGKVFAILNNIYSTIASLADKSFPIHAGVEIGVVSTKAFSGQIATIWKLFGAVVTDLEFKKMIEWMEDNKLMETVNKVIGRYKTRESLYIIGKSLCLSVASEMSLKIKEASYIHAESFAAGELKHGVISLIEKETFAIVCDGVHNVSADLENSAIQIHSRGGDLLGIGFENKPYYKYFISLPEVGNLSILAISFVGQLLAYGFAISKNLDPDKPRNLAKSVTVK